MPGFYSTAILDRVRSSNDIVDVIGAHVQLKRAGANFVAICPFHKEKTPSFNVNPQRQIFHCFGCHAGGDVFKFIMAYEGVDFPDSVRRLADRAKIVIETENLPGRMQDRHIKDRLLQVHEQITQRWQNCLANEAGGQAARDYLAGRGVSAEAIGIFRLGCAPDCWDDTVNWARSKDYDLPLMEQSGLILRKEGGDSYYDRFRGRLMFPIADEQGRVIGFSGRVLDPEAKTAKYVNSPETPLFTKGKVLFGIDKSKRDLLEAQVAIVCEGQLDLISCYVAGIRNIVAPQGTALTPEHTRILKRYVDEVVLCFDSDNAGQKAAVRSLDSLLASGLAIRVAVVPEPHDPDSYIRQFGSAAFKELIGRAEGFFDYYLQRLCATNELTSDRGRVAVLEAMASAVFKTGNAMLVDKYAQKTALRLGVGPEAVRSEFRKYSQTKAASPAMQEEPDKPAEQAEANLRPSIIEFGLLKVLLLHDESVERVQRHLDLNWLQHPGIRGFVQSRLSAHDRGDWRDIAAFLAECQDAQLNGLVTEVATASTEIIEPERQCGDILLRLRNEFLERRMQELTQRSQQAESDDELCLDLLRQRESLRKMKSQPLSALDAAKT